MSTLSRTFILPTALGGLLLTGAPVAAANDQVSNQPMLFDGQHAANVVTKSCSADHKTIISHFMIVADSHLMQALPRGTRRHVFQTAAENLRVEWGAASREFSFDKVDETYDRLAAQNATHGMGRQEFVGRRTLAAAKAVLKDVADQTRVTTSIQIITEPANAAVLFSGDESGIVPCDNEMPAIISSFTIKMPQAQEITAASPI